MESTVNWVTIILGVGQALILLIGLVFGLTIKTQVQSTRAKIMKDVQAQYVSAPVSAQQFANTNILLTNLTTEVSGLKTEVGNLSVQMAHLEGKVGNGFGRKA